LTIRFSTFADSRKVAQIKKNPEVHLTCGISDLSSAERYLQSREKRNLQQTEQNGKPIGTID
jgi:general stress protein 26